MPTVFDPVPDAELVLYHAWMSSASRRVRFALEEKELPYVGIFVRLLKNEQNTPEYLKLSPNNKIPAIIDTDGPGGGHYTMMESGAILWYLGEKTGKFIPKDARKRYDTLQWLIFQMAHVGPMFGQANHFNTYAKDNLQYAKDRYNNESVRLYRVLDNRLRESPWVGCDEYTIADMAIYPWTKGHADRGIDKARYPSFMRWFAAMQARPAVQRNDKLATEIRARMAKAAENRQQIDMFDTRDNASRLTQATQR